MPPDDLPPWVDDPPDFYEPPHWVWEQEPRPPARGGEQWLQQTGILLEERPTGYAVGVAEVWQDPQTGQETGVYLHLAEAPHLERAEQMQANILRLADEQAIPDADFGNFAHDLIKGRGDWQPLNQDQWALLQPTPDTPNFMDETMWAARDQLLAQTFAVTERDELKRQEIDEPHELIPALQTLGLQAPDFDPRHNPPPLFDEESQTAYWIGVYQPNPEAPAIAAVLAVGQDEAGHPTAHLAPVMQGTPEQAQTTAEYLLAAAERTQDIGQVLDLAEGMAVATQQREQWSTTHGIPLEIE